MEFLLVSQAALCAPHLVDYAQLEAEEKAGRIIFDPLLQHEGVWLLDHAIAARVKSDAGLRDQKKNRGAHPGMDALWSRWLHAAPEGVLGSKGRQAARAAKLSRLGCSLSLGAALERGLDPALIQAKDDAQQSSSLGLNILSRAIRDDYLATVKVLVRYGFSRLPFSAQHHPLKVVRSADILQVLLDAGLDPDDVPLTEGSLIDFTAARDLAAGTMHKLIEVLRKSGRIKDGRRERVARIGVGLEKKSLEQLRTEMRDANWPSVNNETQPSPIVEWARWKINNPVRAGFEMSTPALQWLARQPGIGRPRPGQKWSDAAWLWAVSMANAPASCEIFSSASKELKGLAPAKRFEVLGGFLESEGLPRSFASSAVCASLQDASYHRNKSEQVIALFHCLFRPTKNGAWVLGAYTEPQPKKSNLEAILAVCRTGENAPVASSQWMSLALIIASVEKDGFLVSAIKQAWNDGIRPLGDPADRKLVLNRDFLFDQELSSMVSSWDLSAIALPATGPTPPRRF